MGLKFGGAVSAGTVLQIAGGGTGKTNATDALNALLPAQTGLAGGVLTTDGTTTSWVVGGGSIGNFGVTSVAFNDITSKPTTLTGYGITDGASLIIPQNIQSAAYTTVLDDTGKHILHPASDTAARTITIPSNSDVAYPIGTALTFVNQNAAGIITIAINTDTMRLAGAGTTGSRTLTANGVATALKITNTEWLISGTNLT